MDPLDLIKHNRDVYNTIAQHFSVSRAEVWDDLIPLAEYTKDGDSVLDLGCGNGRLYQILGKKQVKYVGLDQSEELIALARAKFPEVEFVVGEMTALPFGDATFDAIYCIAAMNHIPGRELQLQCLKEMHRVLKPGGHVLMTNWNLFSETAQAKAKENDWVMSSGSEGAGIDVMVPWKSSEGETLGQRYYHGFTMDELKDLCTAAGFGILDQYYTRKDERVTIAEGGNLVSILKK